MNLESFSALSSFERVQEVVHAYMSYRLTNFETVSDIRFALISDELFEASKYSCICDRQEMLARLGICERRLNNQMHEAEKMLCIGRAVS